MNDRKIEILRQLTKNIINEEELKNKLDISSRKLAYRINQINEDLKIRGLPIIYKEQGKYIIGNDTLQSLTNISEEMVSVYSPENRINLLILNLSLSLEELSLNHLAFNLNVSKNTILNDIKIVRQVLKKYELEVKYSRENGYEIIGDEFDIRTLLQNVMLECLTKYQIDGVMNILQPIQLKIQEIKNEMHKIEKFLNLKFTDDDYYNLVLLFAVSLRRIEKNKEITTLNYIDYKEITASEEYQVIKFMNSQIEGVNESEIIYWALQLLSARRRDTRMLMREDIPLLSNALWEFLNELELHALISIQNKKELLKKLVLHFEPAYYRIKYNLNVTNVLYQDIIEKYNVLHNFVSQSIKPLEDFFKMKIPDQEISYITLFIGGHILSDDHVDTEGSVVKAVILCPNGITMSKLLEKNLSQLFPEFVFYPSLSIREYEGFILPHDIVFSTVSVSTDKNLFIVNELLDDSNKLKLRQRVIKKIYNLDFLSVGMESIIKVIKKYSTISNEERLIMELNQLFLNGSGENDKHKENDSVMNLINESNIQIINQKLTFNSMLEIACDPLKQAGIVDDTFVEKLKTEYKEQPEYILLRNKVALPHLNPEIINQRLGISVVINKEGFRYNHQTLHLLIVLTTPDKTSHLDVLFMINKIARDTQTLNRLMEADTETEVENILTEFELEER
ncbi:BglG family transcription antiterminator [Aerococcaceae bacterium WGS1372]